MQIIAVRHLREKLPTHTLLTAPPHHLMLLRSHQQDRRARVLDLGKLGRHVDPVALSNDADGRGVAPRNRGEGVDLVDPRGGSPLGLVLVRDVGPDHSGQVVVEGHVNLDALSNVVPILIGKTWLCRLVPEDKRAQSSEDICSGDLDGEGGLQG